MLPDIITDIERDLSIEQVLSHYGYRAASDQDADGRTTRYFCPLPRCKGDKRPHFVVEHDRLADEYGRPIGEGARLRKGSARKERWRCLISHEESYGPVTLVAAINGLTTRLSQLTRDELVRVVRDAAAIIGRPTKELDPTARNGWLSANPPVEHWRICLSDGFSPDAIRALAVDDLRGVPMSTIADVLHHQFGLWQVEKYIMAACYPSDERREPSAYKSYERRAHALFPMFAFCYDFETGAVLTENPEKRAGKWVARIVMPAYLRERGEDFDWRSDLWAVVGSETVKEDLADWHRRTALFGDAVAMATVASGDAASAVAGTGEVLQTEVEEEVEEEDERGRRKKELRMRRLEPGEVRLQRCVLCRRALDGVTAYLWLNYPRMRFTDEATGECGSEFHRNNYWHTAWLRSDTLLLNPFEAGQLSRMASSVFELFGNDRQEVMAANANAMRYNFLRLCMLPTSMSEMDAVDSGFGLRHVPHTPNDFFRYYEPTNDDMARHLLVVGSDDGVKALILQNELNGASQLRPFTRVQKRKKEAGQKAYTYEVNLAAAWQMMANKGYCRSILPGSRNTIGQCFRIDGHFVYELDSTSVMADMRKSLEDYAKDASRGDVDDVEMMMNAMLKCRDLQYDRNITKLPLMALPKSESYGPELDYFFFRNGALEVTPRRIVFRRYDDLDFLVYRSQVLPFDYHQPFYGSRSPIEIRQSAEYERRQREYEEARRSGEKTAEELFEMKQRLRDFGAVGQWEVRITATEADDPRIDVPMSVRRGDGAEWLRWWPFLRLLRCFANEDWQREEAGVFSDLDRRTLMARMANLMFTLGRCVYRYHGSAQYIPYFLENTVNREGKAQGGSGKSMLVNHFLSFVRNVLIVDGRSMSRPEDTHRHFAGYVHHFHDVVHIEDYGKYPIDALFNYASSDFKVRALYENEKSIPREEAPNLVITSNYVMQSTDESSLGRVQFGGMSHYFSRDIGVLNKPGRGLDTVVPDFEYHPERCTPEFRGQVIYTLAKCLQFCMQATALGVKVDLPGTNLLERLSRAELGDIFYDWFTDFLEKDYVYNVPISINEIFNDYRLYLDTSKARFDSVSRSKFYLSMQSYCAKPAHGVSFMPIKPFLTASEVTRSRRRSEDGTEKSYLRKGVAWQTAYYVGPEGEVRSARGLFKNAGVDSPTGGAVWFARRGEEPKDVDEMLHMMEAFAGRPDPAPVTDDDGRPVSTEAYAGWARFFTVEEAERYAERVRLRRDVPRAASAPVASPAPIGEVLPPQEVPF